MPPTRADTATAAFTTAITTAIITLAVLLLAIPPALAEPSPVRVTYRAPVPGPVIDPYRPPSTPYGPGNRGIDYATTPGEPVVAPADGEVTFAGAVGGGLHVVVLHGDGIRTSLSFLAVVLVGRGQRVAGGEAVGRAASTLHFGARRGEAYLDPAALLAGSSAGGRAVLVPEGPGRQLGAGDEADGLRRLLQGDQPAPSPPGAAAAGLTRPVAMPADRVWAATLSGAPPGLALLLAAPAGPGTWAVSRP